MIDNFVQTNPDGSVWYFPPDGRPAQELTGTDSLCGAGIFELGADDVFTPACAVHDHFYTNRAWYEDRGFFRADLDELFYGLMLKIAGDDKRLRVQAAYYYEIVKDVGWIWYDRHPAGTGSTL